MENPIDSYLEAVEAHRQGDDETAARKLSRALGAEEPTEPIRGATAKMLTPGQMAHDVALGLLTVEAEKFRRGENV